jgi:opacity protein-like surface antigen
MGKLFRSALLAAMPVIFFAALSTSCVQAQDAPRIEVTGNYSYLRYDSFPLGFRENTGVNGANISVAYNFTTRLAAFGEVGGNWGDPFRFYDGMGGGRYSYRHGSFAFFGQGMFGKAKSHIAIPTALIGGESASAFAYGGGGGISYDLTPHFAVRVIQVDYIHAKLFETPVNNIRFSAGITYHIGRVRLHKRPRLTQ